MLPLVPVTRFKLALEHGHRDFLHLLLRKTRHDPSISSSLFFFSSSSFSSSSSAATACLKVREKLLETRRDHVLVLREDGGDLGPQRLQHLYPSALLLGRETRQVQRIVKQYPCS